MRHLVIQLFVCIPGGYVFVECYAYPLRKRENAAASLYNCTAFLKLSKYNIGQRSFGTDSNCVLHKNGSPFPSLIPIGCRVKICMEISIHTGTNLKGYQLMRGKQICVSYQHSGLTACVLCCRSIPIEYCESCKEATFRLYNLEI